MRVFVTGGTGHSGSSIIPELVAAGHEVTGLARSDTAAAALSALGAKVRRLVAAGSIGSSGQLGRPAREEDPALDVGDEHKGTLRVRNVVETAVIDLAARGVRSSVVRIANIAHSTTDRAGQDEGIPLREIAEAIGSRLGLPAVSIPMDELMIPGYFGFLANIVTQTYPASNRITRRTLGWEHAQPGLLADLDNGHYFPVR